MKRKKKKTKKKDDDIRYATAALFGVIAALIVHYYLILPTGIHETIQVALSLFTFFIAVTVVIEIMSKLGYDFNY